MTVISTIFEWLYDVIAFSRETVVFKADTLFWARDLTLFDCEVSLSLAFLLVKLFLSDFSDSDLHSDFDDD